MTAWHIRCPLGRVQRLRDDRVVAFRNTGHARQLVTRGRVEMDLINRLRALVRDDSGQDLIEYALLAALIALASVLAIQQAGAAVNAVWVAIVGMLGAIPV
jgi:Flp pilus assembly pilin Flp